MKHGNFFLVRRLVLKMATFFLGTVIFQPFGVHEAFAAQSNGKMLVAYFSTSGVTAQAAKTIAEVTGADLYEIVPEQPYTSADLDWHDKQSRSSLEMNNDAARPVIKTKCDITAYGTIFIGYPIWWGQAPRIINTFLERYDFSGKVIVPFCTSGGSPIGKSGTLLQPLTKGAIWREGERFSGSVSADTVKKWITEMKLNQ